jgi:hypothetical protein
MSQETTTSKLDQLLLQQLVAGPKETKASKRKNYVDPDSFRLALIESNAKGQLTPACVKMIQLMITRIQSSFKYVDPQDQEDCYSAAQEVVLTKWQKYDISRDNPFAYFTRMIYNGLYAGWNELDKGRVEHSLSNVFIEPI